MSTRILDTVDCWLKFSGKALRRKKSYQRNYDTYQLLKYFSHQAYQSVFDLIDLIMLGGKKKICSPFFHSPTLLHRVGKKNLYLDNPPCSLGVTAAQQKNNLMIPLSNSIKPKGWISSTRYLKPKCWDVETNTLPKFNSSPLKSDLPNRKVVFQPPFFRGYVKLPGGKFPFFITPLLFGFQETRPHPSSRQFRTNILAFTGGGKNPRFQPQNVPR